MKHETILTGLRFTDAPALAEPTILRFEEPDFVNVFFDELLAPDWRDRIAARVVTSGDDGVLMVEQPVHRAFHLAVIDARCLTPGLPRLDPAKVASAGLVIRRQTAAGPLGWMRRGKEVLGWKPVPADAGPGAGFDPYRANFLRPAPQALVYDPDATLRQDRKVGRNLVLRHAPPVLEAEAYTEDVMTLVPVPPETCKAIGMTLLFCFLPVTSPETEPATATPPPFAVSDVAGRVPKLFQAGFGGETLPPVATTTAPNILRTELVRPEETPGGTRGAGLRTLKSALTWLAQECGAFAGGAEAAAIKAALNTVTLTDADGSRYFDWLEKAYNRLIVPDGSQPDTLGAPSSWPELPATARAALTDAGFAAMAARWGRLSPLTLRYPAGRRSYRMRAFVRIDDCPGCPPRIVWSGPSRPFRIKPWFASGDGRPIQIEMPSLTDESLRNMKPNVAVKVPPSLQQHMDRMNLSDLLDGKHTKTTVSLGMICGFSIPIITICAFIILQIFLGLLNIVFFWLAFVRICIPFPIVETEEE